ncbi:hypothetical protein BJF80_10265 [Serinicoccus sp. CUA-874]|nr:hypothetical protein BJF80_10265 [Serinicoccus sp. CUA-874]
MLRREEGAGSTATGRPAATAARCSGDAAIAARSDRRRTCASAPVAATRSCSFHATRPARTTPE